VARALAQRFAAAGNLTDLLEATRLMESAVEAAPSRTAEQASYLSDLAGLHASRHDQTGDASALAAAADAYQRAALADPDASARRPAAWRAAGRALTVLGAYSRAVEVYRAAADEWERLLGAEHQDTLSVRVDLARALLAAGRSADAAAVAAQALPALVRVVGPHHPLTARARRLAGHGGAR